MTNGNYVVASPDWDNGAIDRAGAVTWGAGDAGIVGPITAENSLVGGTASDRASGFGINPITAIEGGNYAFMSRNWTLPATNATGAGAAVARAGAVTIGNGAEGTVGLISTENSITGATEGAGASMVMSFGGTPNVVVVGIEQENRVVVSTVPFAEEVGFFIYLPAVTKK